MQKRIGYLLNKWGHSQNQWVTNLSQWNIRNMDILNLLIFNISRKSSCKLLASTGVESTKNRSFSHHKSLISKLPLLIEKIPLAMLRLWIVLNYYNDQKAMIILSARRTWITLRKLRSIQATPASDSALESGFSEDRHAQIIYFSMIYVCQVLLNSRKNIFYVM